MNTSEGDNFRLKRMLLICLAVFELFIAKRREQRCLGTPYLLKSHDVKSREELRGEDKGVLPSLIFNSVPIVFDSQMSPGKMKNYHMYSSIA
jgi:hypothetical protein